MAKDWRLNTATGAEVVSEEEIRRRLLAGEITPEWYVWRDGMADWRPIGSIPDLAAVAASPPSTPPPLPPQITRAARKISRLPIYVGAVVVVVAIGGGYWAYGSRGATSQTPPPAVPTPVAAGNAPVRERPSPVAVGEEYDVWVDGPSRDNPNHGVAHIRGLVVFVPAKMGENVRIRITKINPRSANAEVIGPGSGGDTSVGAADQPVTVGQEIDVTITQTGNSGDGIARVEGFVIFVPGTRPGDHVRIRITSVAPRFAHGLVI